MQAIGGIPQRDGPVVAGRCDALSGRIGRYLVDLALMAQEAARVVALSKRLREADPRLDNRDDLQRFHGEQERDVRPPLAQGVSLRGDASGVRDIALPNSLVALPNSFAALLDGQNTSRNG